jgi:predicted O-methyltransferase YrrM
MPSEYMFEDVRSYCDQHDIPLISEATAVWLEEFLKIHRPTNILEIGSAAGYSSLMMASLAQER